MEGLSEIKSTIIFVTNQDIYLKTRKDANLNERLCFGKKRVGNKNAEALLQKTKFPEKTLGRFMSSTNIFEISFLTKFL